MTRILLVCLLAAGCTSSTRIVGHDDDGGALVSDAGPIVPDAPDAGEVVPDATTLHCLPSAEACNAIDDDCDGRIDESLALGTCALWALFAGGTSADSYFLDTVAGLAIDADDNVYLAGMIADGADFGDGPMIWDDAYQASYVASFTRDGTLRWKHVYPNANLHDMTLGSGGLVVVGDGSLGADDFGDAFVARFALDGTLGPVFPVSGENFQFVDAVAIDAAGNLFITGHFQVELTIGPTTIHALGGHDAYVASLFPSGVLRWIEPIQTAEGNEDGLDIAVDAHGHLVVGGHLDSTSLDIAGMTAELDHPRAFFGPLFLAGLDADTGRARWARGVDLEMVALSDTSLLIDDGLTVLVAHEPDSDDSHVVAFDDAGDPLWDTVLSPGFGGDPRRVSVAPSGDLWVIGNFYDSLTIGAMSVSETDLDPNTGDVFFARFDRTSGAVDQLVRWGGPSNDGGTDIAYRSDGAMVIAGYARTATGYGPFVTSLAP